MPFSVKGLDEVEEIMKRAEKALNNTWGAPFMKVIGAFAMKKIKTRTQLGRGVAKNNGPEGKFIGLKPATKKQRANAFLSDRTSPGRSNLTRTGQLLNSMFIKSAQTRKVILDLKDNRKAGKNSPSGKSKVKNTELAAWHESGAGNLPPRPFFHLSSSQILQIEGLARRRLKKAFDKL